MPSSADPNRRMMSCALEFVSSDVNAAYRTIVFHLSCFSKLSKRSGPVKHSKFVGQRAASNQAPALTADHPLARRTTFGQNLKGRESCRHVDQEGGTITWVERANWGRDRLHGRFLSRSSGGLPSGRSARWQSDRRRGAHRRVRGRARCARVLVAPAAPR